jgi:hypothetical protein
MGFVRGAWFPMWVVGPLSWLGLGFVVSPAIDSDTQWLWYSAWIWSAVLMGLYTRLGCSSSRVVLDEKYTSTVTMRHGRPLTRREWIRVAAAFVLPVAVAAPVPTAWLDYYAMVSPTLAFLLFCFYRFRRAAATAV